MKKNCNFNREKDVEIVGEEHLYEGFFKVKQYQLKHRLFGGGWSSTLTREIFDRLPVAACLPYDPIRNQVILIEQFRVGAIAANCPWLVEIVAGIANEGDQSPEDIIYREIQEECGLTPLAIKKIYEYWVSPGGSNEFLTLYCAKVDASKAGGIHGVQGENEDIMNYVFDTEEAFELLNTGKICNGITIVALQWLQLNKEKLNREWL